MQIINVSRKEWKLLQDTAEKEWHFELCKEGKNYKPVKGKYNPDNPKHLKHTDVIHINEGLK